MLASKIFCKLVRVHLLIFYLLLSFQPARCVGSGLSIDPTSGFDAGSPSLRSSSTPRREAGRQLSSFDKSGDLREAVNEFIQNQKAAESKHGRIESWDVSQIKDFSNLFRGKQQFNANLASWDTSSATSMNSMFEGAESFDSDIGNWDVSSVRGMRSMFKGATRFNRNLDKWNTGNVQDMASMFQRTDTFNGTIGTWDTSRVLTMEKMFMEATIFDQNIDSWDTKSVETMESMFEGAARFNQEIRSWDVSNVRSFVRMFFEAASFQGCLADWAISESASRGSFTEGSNAILLGSCAPTSSPTAASGTTSPTVPVTLSPTISPTPSSENNSVTMPVDLEGSVGVVSSTQKCFVDSQCTSETCDMNSIGTVGQCSVSPWARYSTASFIIFLMGATAIMLNCCVSVTSERFLAQREKMSRAEHGKRLELAAKKSKGLFQLDLIRDWRKEATGLLIKTSKLDACLSQAMVNTYLRQIGPLAHRVLWQVHTVLLCATVSLFKLDSDLDDIEKFVNLKEALSTIESGLRNIDLVISKNGADVNSSRTVLEEISSTILGTCTKHSWLICWPSGDSAFEGLPAVGEALELLDTRDALIGLNSSGFERLQWRVLSEMPTFARAPGGESAFVPRNFARFRRNRLFYGSYWLMASAIFISFLARINNPEAMNPSDSFRGGMGTSFLPVPPQYNFAKSAVQSAFIPIVYGFMHNALFALGLLPVFVCRGLWRDIAKKWPQTREYLPLNDFEHVHKALGILVLIYLLCGGIVWVLVMSVECLGNETPDACVAFEKAGNLLNPIENVIALRAIVLITWFPVFPLMLTAQSGPSTGLVQRLGSFGLWLRQNWFEICLYSHITVALLTVLLALIARFQVFFPILPTWLLYAFDRVREYFFCRVSMDLDVLKSVTVFNRSSGATTQPTSMRIDLKPKVSNKRKLKVQAGQYVYVQVPSIDMTWHAFSLASPSSCESLELHIGITASAPDQWQATTEEDQTAMLSWKQKNPTWTFKLLERLRGTRNPPETPVRVMGPYGTASSTCFDKRYAAAIIVGAGTGLTACESVLRETINRRSNPDPVLRPPMRTWLVWSCKSMDDLHWTWDGLVATLVEASQQGTLDASRHSETSQCLDWLHVCLYVTERDAQARFENFKQAVLLDHASLIGTTNMCESLDMCERLEIPAAFSSESPNSTTSSASAPLSDGSSSKELSTTSFQLDRREPTDQKTIASFNVPDELGPTLAFSGKAPDVTVNGWPTPEAYSAYFEKSGQMYMQRQRIKVMIEKWLLTRVVTSSMGSQDAHFVSLLHGARRVCNIDFPDLPLTVSYCGPEALGNVVQDAVSHIDPTQRVEHL